MGIVLEAKRTESALTSTGPPFVHTRVRGPIGGWGAPRDTVIGSLDFVWVKVCWLGAFDGLMLAIHEREGHSLGMDRVLSNGQMSRCKCIHRTLGTMKPSLLSLVAILASMAVAVHA